MIKVVFKQHELIKQNDCHILVKEIDCFASLYLTEFNERQIWTTVNQYTLVNEDDIESIKKI